MSNGFTANGLRLQDVPCMGDIFGNLGGQRLQPVKFLLWTNKAMQIKIQPLAIDIFSKSNRWASAKIPRSFTVGRRPIFATPASILSLASSRSSPAFIAYTPKAGAIQSCNTILAVGKFSWRPLLSPSATMPDRIAHGSATQLPAPDQGFARRCE